MAITPILSRVGLSVIHAYLVPIVNGSYNSRFFQGSPIPVILEAVLKWRLLQVETQTISGLERPVVTSRLLEFLKRFPYLPPTVAIHQPIDSTIMSTPAINIVPSEPPFPL